MEPVIIISKKELLKHPELGAKLLPLSTVVKELENVYRYFIKEGKRVEFMALVYQFQVEYELSYQ